MPRSLWALPEAESEAARLRPVVAPVLLHRHPKPGPPRVFRCRSPNPIREPERRRHPSLRQRRPKVRNRRWVPDRSPDPRRQSLQMQVQVLPAQHFGVPGQLASPVPLKPVLQQVQEQQVQQEQVQQEQEQEPRAPV